MNTKLAALVLVAVLLGSSLGGIIAVTQTKVVGGATGGSAQAAPHFAELNPDFINYTQNLSAGNASTRASAQATTGFIPPPLDLKQLKGQSIRPALVGSGPPSSYDLRTPDKNKVTPVKNQGGCGACWAFAAYASLESYLKPSETWDFSENNMKNTHGFDPLPCNGGNEFFATAYLARWSGPVSESDDPYQATNAQSSPNNLLVQKHVQDVYFIPDHDNDNIKQAVMTYGAVYTQMWFDQSPSRYNPSTYAYYSQVSAINHGVAIVGWDDSFSATNFATGYQPPGNGAFIVKNSIGASWGDEGYFYVSYYDARIGTDNAVFTAQPTTTYNNIYQYDPLGATGAFGQGSSSEWGANVFTATADGNLAAVSFYTLSFDAPYEVYVYTGPTAGPITPGAAPAAQVTGSTHYPGYHTVPLTSIVSLLAGQKFSVVVKFTSSDGTPVPTESPIPNYSSKATANVGESYYHADAGNPLQGGWTDITSLPNGAGANTNICIKAFTTTYDTRGWESLSGQIASGTGPGVSSWSSGRLDVFVEGADHAMYHKWFDGGWSDWERFDGYLTSSPTAVSWGNGRIDVFARGGDGALYHKWFSSTAGWSAWENLGGQLAPGTGPGVSSWASGRLDVFVEGTDGALYHKWFDGGWSGWERFDGLLTSSPAAVSWGNGRIDVFVRGGDGAMYHKWFDGGWSGWERFDRQIAPGTGPGVSSWASGRLDVFVEGADHAMYHKWFDAGWHDSEPLGGYLTSSPAAVSWDNERIDVFARGYYGDLIHKWFDKGWSS